MELIENNREKFEIYFKILVEYNEKVNLTSIVDKEEVFIKHLQLSIGF